MAGSRTAVVRRITVDEKLADDLIRILVAELGPDINLFGDAPGQWGDEKEVLVTPHTYRRRFGGAERAPAWRDLKECQVYLSGAFELRGDPQAPDGFVRSPGRDGFLRIDLLPQVKDAGKKLYARLLHGETNHGTPDRA